MAKSKDKKAEVICRGDWFQDVSEFGENKKYFLVCVDTPCKMGLISWPDLGPYTNPVQVHLVFDITPEELNKIMGGHLSHFKKIPRPKRINVPLWQY